MPLRGFDREEGAREVESILMRPQPLFERCKPVMGWIDPNWVIKRQTLSSQLSGLSLA